MKRLKTRAEMYLVLKLSAVVGLFVTNNVDIKVQFYVFLSFI
jgi:hypothetical protein